MVLRKKFQNKDAQKFSNADECNMTHNACQKMPNKLAEKRHSFRFSACLYGV